MTTNTRAALAGLLALFVASQLGLAALALSGHHRHAWDASAPPRHCGDTPPPGVCWMCLTVSLVSVAAVLSGARALREEPAPLRQRA